MADVIPAVDVPYITVAQVRTEGVTVAEAADSVVLAKIALYTQLVDRLTRQWFNRRDVVITAEGKNSNLFQLDIPIIEVDLLRINHHLPSTAGELIDPSLFTAFNSRTKHSDDRRNPRIKMLANRGSIFGNFGRTFRRGLLTDITGKFGFIEPDGTTPLAIQEAMLRLVIRNIKNPILGSVSGSESGGAVGPRRREKTDLHEIEFFESAANKKASTTNTATGDAEVDRILALYKGPIGIGGSINDIPRVDDGARF